MLIRPCNKVLKSINYSCQTKSDKTDSFSLMVYFNNRTNNLDLHESIRQLIKDGYVTAIEHTGYWDEIAPTYRGRHYSQYRWVVAKEVLLKSFLIPVAVALATTLITLAISGLLT